MDFVGIDKLSLLDYADYVSCVVFAPKCNFRCPFCHNGESVLGSSYSISMDEIVSYLNERKGILDAVVVSGGEPTLMDDIVDKIRVFKSLGLKIKLDSNGTNPDVIQKLLDEHLLDYIAMDIKNSEEKYPLTAGYKVVNMSNIKKSIEIIMNSGIDYEFRTTLVEEFHNKDDMEGLGELIKGSKKLFLQKFVDREGVIQKGLHPVSLEEATSYKDILSSYIKEVNLRGY